MNALMNAQVNADVNDPTKPLPVRDEAPAARRTRTIRLAIVLGLVAVAFYVGFIALTVMRSR